MDEVLMVTAFILIGALALFLVLSTRATRPAKPITNPRLVLWNCLGPAADTLVAADEKALRPLFRYVRRSSSTVPPCDVLLIYATIGVDGSIDGTGRKLREIIALSGASVVIVATDNPMERYKPALAPLQRSPGMQSSGAANIVLTLERRGDYFGRSLIELFTCMNRGISMPLAWVQMAPQYEGAPEHEHLPATVFLCERGQIRFKRTGS